MDRLRRNGVQGVLAAGFALTAVCFSAESFGEERMRDYAWAAFEDDTRAERVKATADAVGEIYGQYHAQQRTPGLVYGVVLDGALVYFGGFGSANIDDNIPVSDTTLFRIASMSKSFTAMAVLQLRDAGKLRLDDPISSYVGDHLGSRYPTLDSPEALVVHRDSVFGDGWPCGDVRDDA